MKQSTKAIIWTAATILVIGGSLFAYQMLKNNYDETQQTSSQTSSSEIQLTPASDFTVYDADGNEVTLSSKFGKPIVLNFWASWCGPCQSELPDFNKVYAELGGQVEFFMVNLDSAGTEDDVQDFLTENGYTFPVYYDTNYEGAIAYGVTGIPASYFINSDGNIVVTQHGMISEETLRSSIDQILD